MHQGSPDMQGWVGEDLMNKSRLSTQQITNPPSVACVWSGAPPVSLYTEQLLSVLVTDTERRDQRAGSGQQSTSPRPAPSPPGTLANRDTLVPLNEIYHTVNSSIVCKASCHHIIMSSCHHVIMSSFIMPLFSRSTGLLSRQK